METLKLECTVRDVTGKKVKKYRRIEKIPAVIYGKKTKSENILLRAFDVKRIYQAAGENTVIELQNDGKKKNVLIHDVQTHPLTGNIIHVDFLEVDMDIAVETEVPLELIGISPAVKDHNGILITNMNSIEVKCLPSNIPHTIQVDISVLKDFHDHITVADLKLDKNIEILSNAESVIITIQAPRTAAEIESLNEDITEDVNKVEGVADKVETAANSEAKK